MAYPLNSLREEVAFIAYHFHWPLSEIYDLPHPERVAWVGEISKINERIIKSRE
ncbi:MAG: DUF6760 family protein [Myxococcota bacterium]